MTQSLVNGVAADTISIKDRAFNYGDGVFETIAVHNKKLHYWAEHFSRLKHGCERLGITAPVEADLLTDIAKLSFNDESSVLKIVISRGQGGRGYAAAGITEPNIIISNNPWPAFVESHQQQGITVRICQHRLMINPALVGIKHLNRLDQVLARNEWHNDLIQEGLMRDQEDDLVEGISSNLFIKINNEWTTPPDQDCAVSGVMRKSVLAKAEQLGITIKQRKINQSELSLVQEMFVCNSIWGIVPVLACGDIVFKTSDDCKQVQKGIKQDIAAVSYDI